MVIASLAADIKKINGGKKICATGQRQLGWAQPTREPNTGRASPIGTGDEREQVCIVEEFNPWYFSCSFMPCS